MVFASLYLANYVSLSVNHAELTWIVSYFVTYVIFGNISECLPLQYNTIGLGTFSVQHSVTFDFSYGIFENFRNCNNDIFSCGSWVRDGWLRLCGVLGRYIANSSIAKLVKILSHVCTNCSGLNCTTCYSLFCFLFFKDFMRYWHKKVWIRVLWKVYLDFGYSLCLAVGVGLNWCRELLHEGQMS